MRRRAVSGSFTLLAGLSLTFAAGCKQRTGAASGVKLINGVETDAFPAVVPLLIQKGNNWSGCTGIYTDATTVITALHCIADGLTGKTFPAVLGNIDAALPTAAYFDTAYLQALHSQTFAPDHDVAVLRYDPAFATDLGVTEFLRVNSSGAVAGSPVSLIGFGATAVGAPVSDTAHIGTNVIGFVGDGYLMVTGVAHGDARHPVGTSVSVAGGDSGGPLLNAQGEVIGVCSFDQWDLMRNWVAAQYFDASNPLLAKLLAKAVAKLPSDGGTAVPTPTPTAIPVPVPPAPPATPTATLGPSAAP